MPEPVSLPDPPALADTDLVQVVALHRVLKAPIDLSRVPAGFGPDVAAWLGAPGTPDVGGMTPYVCDLELQVGPDRRTPFRKSAIVSLGIASPTSDGYAVPIEWRAASLAPLFPVLVGQLVIRPDQLVLDGHYAPPFGHLGYFLDRRLLTIAAQGTARWFLGRVAEILAPRS